MFRSFGKYLSYFLSASIFGAWLGSFAGTRSAVAIGAALFLSFAVAALFWVERFWTRQFAASLGPASPGLLYSLHEALSHSPRPSRAPRVFTLRTPLPLLICARRPFGRGVIFVSAGALGMWSEERLRKALARACSRLAGADEPIRGWAAWMSYRYLEKKGLPQSVFTQIRWILSFWMTRWMSWLSAASSTVSDSQADAPSDSLVAESLTWSVIYRRLAV